MKFEIEIDGVNAPIEDVETAIKDILYNQLDMELGADYKKFKVNVNHLNDKRNEKIVKEETVLDMDDSDYAVAGGICFELLNEIGVSDGESVLEVVANALKINPHGTEVNGDLVKEVTHDGMICTSGSPMNKHYLLPEDVEWLRVEHYAKGTNTPCPCIMYVYIHKKPDSDEFDMDNVQFDYYPNPETDDYVDGVQYSDCVRHMGRV